MVFGLFRQSNLQKVEKFINGREVARCGDFSSWLERNMADDVEIVSGTDTIPKAGFVDAAASLSMAVHDWKFEILEPFVQKEDGTIVGKVRSVGTHTGLPFSFAGLPEVEAQTPPVELANDPETLTFTFDEFGKISKLVIFADGYLSGPAGFYKQMGGRLPSFNPIVSCFEALGKLVTSICSPPAIPDVPEVGPEGTKKIQLVMQTGI